VLYIDVVALAYRTILTWGRDQLSAWR